MLILLLLLLLTAPVTCTILRDGSATLRVTVWGIGRTVPLTMPKGHGAPSPAQILRLAGTVLRTDHCRRFLFRHIHLLRLDVLFTLGLDDPARTALLSGALQQAARWLPHPADVRIQPDFFHQTRLQARCIVFFHLGTLLPLSAMVLWAYFLESKEHPAKGGN